MIEALERKEVEFKLGRSKQKRVGSNAGCA